MTVENEQPNNPETETNEAADTVSAQQPEAQQGESQLREQAEVQAEQRTDDLANARTTPGDDGGAEAAAVSEEHANSVQEIAADEKPKGDPRIPAVITNRTLFFLAPDLPPASERPAPSRRRHEEEVEADEAEDEQDSGGRRSARGRGRSRRGSRNQDRRDTHQRDSGRSGSRRDEDSEETVVEEEEQELITEPQKVHGSTRLAAKRARRREGRDSGRRRVAVTESEFQARREAVDRKMLVRAKNNRVQIGVLEDNILVEHYVARNEDVSLIGNVYVGRVQNVLPSMEAAFIDIGGARNAVLYSGEVDWAAAEMGANQPRKIENALKSGDKVLVQVTKDPVGHKGARLTSQVSLPGRYLVYVPGNTMNGISRKLPDTERARLKKILKEVLPEGVGVIVRTAAEGATEEQLQRDVERLTKQWDDIQRKAKNSSKAPQTLHSESDMLVKIVRDVFNEDFDQLIVQGQSELDTIKTYLGQVAPDLVGRVERFNGDDIFSEYRVNDMIDKALARKVWLPSGGSLVIDRTEAMTVVDVNTGKFVGTGGNLEETVTKNNLEAAEEIVRQLRLRDIGGIIVIDFIDMVLESNRDLVERRLVEGLSRDRTKHQVAELTSLGLVQMTRKKIGLGLLETFSEGCTHCDGRGVVIYGEPVGHNQGGQSQGSGRKGRGSRNRGKGQQQNNQQQDSKPQNGHDHQNGATHEITEDARNALTKIAASTIAGNGEAHSHEAETEVEKAVEAATREIVKVVKEIETGKSGRGDSRRQRSKGQPRRGDAKSDNAQEDLVVSAEESAADSSAAEDSGQRSGRRDFGGRDSGRRGAERQRGAEREGTDGQGSGRGSSNGTEGDLDKPEGGSSRRSRRNRRVRTEAPQPRTESDVAEQQIEAPITIDLPAPVEPATEAPKDRQNVESALSSLDAALDSLVGREEPQAGGARADGAKAGKGQGDETQLEGVQAEEPKFEGTTAERTSADETKVEATKVEDAKAEETNPETASDSTGSGRKRGGRRRITTGPISTGSGDES